MMYITNDTLQMTPHRVEGMDVDQILYADDTICISENEEAINRFLSAIETEGETYGLTLNKSKCDYLRFGPAKKSEV